MRRVVVAFDSFKGSLSSREANEAFGAGVRDIMPEVEISAVTISDGGEGFSEAVAEGIGGDIVDACVSDPLGRPIAARYALIDNGCTAVIALASASGLMLLDAAERDPLVVSTYGTGELILDAVSRGCRRVVLGLGGSATCDAGTGLLRALGYMFLDSEGGELTSTIDILERATSISAPASPLRDVELCVAVDVENPLIGERGAARVFAPQKGASPEDVKRLERAMCRFADVVARHVRDDYAMERSMGAAGGVAFGLRAFLCAVPASGICLMLELVNFESLVQGASLVVTGEGRVDCQTVMGKAPSGVLRVSERVGVACVAVGGGVAWCDELRSSGFNAIYAATPDGVPLALAVQRDVAYDNLRAVGRRVAKDYLL